MKKLALYWHTLRYLRPIQFYRRLWFRLYKPRLDPRPAPHVRWGRGNWVSPARRIVSMVGPTTFHFLNETRELDRTGWNGCNIEKLWLYNLHYFDDLNAQDAPIRHDWHIALMSRWVVDNPGPIGNGWEPYPTSLRIVNWVKWSINGTALPELCVQSLAIQMRWLSRRMEWHLLGNHLFVNAKALVFGGLYFRGDEADALLSQGLKIVEQQMPEQVLNDGGNFERSTMYHSLFLEDVLDLINLAQRYPESFSLGTVDDWCEAAVRMLNWLSGMTHPDGQISLFNDAAFGIAPEPSELFAYAKRLNLKWTRTVSIAPLHSSSWLDSGYVRLTSPGAVALLDVAPVGPDYLPGHAHADTLSFELSLFDQRVIVNGGTSRYGLGGARLRERQTVSHSTVEVEGRSSSEVWGGFRVARRAYPIDLQLSEECGRLSVRCAHNGYLNLPGKPIHRREWVMDVHGLMVNDDVGPAECFAVARYILHPTIVVENMGENVWSLHLKSGKKIRINVVKGRSRLEPSNYAPEFGKVFRTQCLAVSLIGGNSILQMIWN